MELGPRFPRLTEERNVLSFDCGTRNLSYALVSQSPDKSDEAIIQAWQNMDLKFNKVAPATEQLIKELDSRPWMLRADCVAIESQVGPKNYNMKALSHAIQAYFITRTVRYQGGEQQNLSGGGSAKTVSTEGQPMPVHFISAQSKFRIVKVPEPPGAAESAKPHKLIGEAMCRKVLQMSEDFEALAFFDAQPKRDDLADCFLQACYTLKQFRAKDRVGTLANENWRPSLTAKPSKNLTVVIDESEERHNGGRFPEHQVFRRSNFMA